MTGLIWNHLLTWRRSPLEPHCCIDGESNANMFGLEKLHGFGDPSWSMRRDTLGWLGPLEHQFYGIPYLSIYQGNVIIPTDELSDLFRLMNSSFSAFWVAQPPTVDGFLHLQQWLPLHRGQVIAGWDLALMKLSQGEKAVVTVPSALAYGPRGYGSLGEPSSAQWGLDGLDRFLGTKTCRIRGRNPEFGRILSFYLYWNPGSISNSTTHSVSWQILRGHMGFGQTPPRKLIPPNSDLIFEVHLVKVRVWCFGKEESCQV